MSKKILIPVILILFVPTIIGLIWFYSSTDKVSTVILIDSEGKEWSYSDSSETEFFVQLSENLTPIEKQIYSPDNWTLYTLKLEKSFDTSVYYLCLSSDEKNCLAYDDEGNWYRIRKEDAKKFLLRGETENVYENSSLPDVFVTLSGQKYTIPSTRSTWNYLLADGTFASASDGTGTVFDSGLFIPSSVGFGVDFSVKPSYFEIKIFDGETKIFSCDDVSALSDFSYTSDTQLKAVIRCVWEETSNAEYHGETQNEFLFDYDVRASATVDKDEYSPGEIAFVTIANAESDDFTITSDISTSAKLTVRDYNGSKLLLIPISADNKAGDYTVTLKSQTATINVALKIKEWNVDDASVKIGNTSFDTYKNAVTSFINKMQALSDRPEITEPYWEGGLLTPIVKFVDGEEQYWISPPTYGAVQVVEGVKTDFRTFGRYYVKAYALLAENIPLEVRSVAKGVVSVVEDSELFGKIVVIDHGFGFCSIYGNVETELKVGDAVESGAVFGKSIDAGITLSDGQIFFALMQDGVFLSPNRFITEHTATSDPLELTPVTGFTK